MVVSFALSCAKRRDPGKGGEGRVFAHRFLFLDASPFLALPVPKTTSYFLQQARRERKKFCIGAKESVEGQRFLRLGTQSAGAS